MKTSIKSRLFLLTYGIILTFIAGLIILNNSFLDNYYRHSRENSLIEAFDEIKTFDIDSTDLQDQVLNVESKHNISVQILRQINPINPSIPWQEFSGVPNLYERLYGNQYSIPQGILSQIIYEFNREMLLGENPTFGKKVDAFDEDKYTAYIVNIQSELQNYNENIEMMGLCVATQEVGGTSDYYILTITVQSIEDSVQIFNSFTIIVGFIFMVFSGLIMYFVSYRVTNPILEMNTVAQEIADLNFNNKVHVSSEDEIGTLGQSINKMSTQLESFIRELQLSNDKLGKEILLKTDVDKMRREFIANASHELKTPLSLIMGYAEALRLPGLDEQTKEEYLSIILDESGKMNRLVMDLLKLSQLENKSMELDMEKISVRQLVEDTLKLFTLVFKENEIKVETDLIDDMIKSDYEQLQTVLTNFINNAINHLDDNKLIKITTKKLDNGSIRLSVFNTGPNISDEEKKNIWESFYKIDKARTRAYGGQGLGLSICKNILEMLGYDYGIENQDDGVVFYFDIYNTEV